MTRAPAERAKFAKAEKLLKQAQKAKRPLDQRLLVAAALTTVMTSPPIVVGGTAEELWTHDEYRPTDLDLIPRPSDADRDAFRKLGLKKEGRHWVSAGFPIAIEFPHDPSFEVRRTSDRIAGGVTVRVIGVDDLYFDRLGQSTSTENVRDQHFASLLAIAIANWDRIDWAYVGQRIRETTNVNPALGQSMMLMHRKALRIGRRELARERAERL